jgi:hypothetical protein
MSIAQDIIDGVICGECNIPFEEENGYPCLCKDCWKAKHPEYPLEPGRVDAEGFQCAAYDLVDVH